MSIKIGNASIDEHGKLSGGTIGDQTGKEICERPWYNKPWNVYLNCTDAKLANKAVNYMKQICANNKMGYDQSQRYTGYNAIINNGKKVEGAKGEFDCSTAVLSCYKLAGLDIDLHNNTSSMRNALLATKKFKAYTDKAHITSDNYAKPGGIYLSEGHHVAMALETGTWTNPYPVPKRIIQLGCQGNDVKYVQWELLAHGIKEVVVDKVKKKVTIDGNCGPITDAAIRAYQKANGLKVDGACGPNTLASFKAK
jgi:Putative peptidoglycan-binding domain-containing protein